MTNTADLTVEELIRLLRAMPQAQRVTFTWDHQPDRPNIGALRTITWNTGGDDFAYFDIVDEWDKDLNPVPLKPLKKTSR